MTDKSQVTTSNAQQLAALLDATGVDAATLATALETIAAAKQGAPKATPAAPASAGKVYLNKELIYEDENAEPEKYIGYHGKTYDGTYKHSSESIKFLFFY